MEHNILYVHVLSSHDKLKFHFQHINLALNFSEYEKKLKEF